MQANKPIAAAPKQSSDEKIKNLISIIGLIVATSEVTGSDRSETDDQCLSSRGTSY